MNQVGRIANGFQQMVKIEMQSLQG